MTSSNNARITDELLSAYIDGAVSAQERELVEAAVAADPATAWRLETLRYTVSLLQQLPEVKLPRSFAFSVLPEPEIAAAVPMATAVAARPSPVAAPRRGFWDAWRDFWQGGNLALRNAGAVALVAFLLLVAGDELLLPALAPVGAPAAVPAPVEMSGQAADTQPDQARTDGARAAQAEAPGEAAAEEAAPEAEASAIDESAATESAAAEGAAVQSAPTAFSQEPAGDAEALHAPEQPASAAAAQAPPFTGDAPMPGSNASGFGAGGAGGAADLAPPPPALLGQGGGMEGMAPPTLGEPQPAPGAALRTEEAAAASPAEAPATPVEEETSQAQPEVGRSAAEAASPAEAEESAAEAAPTSEVAPAAEALAAKTPVELAQASPTDAPAETSAALSETSAGLQPTPLYLYLEVALGAAATMLLLFWLLSRRPAR